MSPRLVRVGSGALLALAPIWILRHALRPGHVPGTELSEVWGRLFVTSQVERWLTGHATPGWGDLLAYPEGRPFWPVDPLVQLIELPLGMVVGPSLALSLLTLVWLWLAGVGPARLALRLGADRSGALTAGLLVQLSPYLLRNLHDFVLEVLALGLVALAMDEALRAVRLDAPRARDWLRVGGSVLLVAGASPYYAVFLALIGLLGPALWWRSWRRWLAVAGCGALACGLALAPLLVAEGDDAGRLGPQYRASGYALTPSPLVDPVTRRPAPPRPPVRAPQGPGPGLESPDAGGPPAAPPPAWKRALHRAPGGAALLGGMLLALLLPGARRAALVAWGIFVVSPGLPLARRALGQHVDEVGGVVGVVLSVLPLGNPTRFLAMAVLCGAVAVGLSVRARPWLVVGLALAAGTEAWSTLPNGTSPATRLTHDPAVLSELSGPTLVFPSGDPPLWHPDVGPKEVLHLAGLAGVPVAYDYGRGGLPADLSALLRLAELGRVPVGVRALEQGSPIDDSAEAWAELPFTHILLLEDRLLPPERTAIRAWLEAHATLLAEGAHSSAWSRPRRF